MSVKVIYSVRHNGASYLPGDVINEISDTEAERLVSLGAAYSYGDQHFPVSKVAPEPKGDSNGDEDDNKSDGLLTELEEIASDLDASYTLEELKERSNEIGFEFKNSISKKELIALIISENKADDFFDGDE